MTSDGRHFIIDSHIGNHHIGTVKVASGAIRLASFAIITIPFARGMIRIILDQSGHWIDPIAGHKIEMQVRIWLMSLDGSVYQPLDPELLWSR